MEIDLKKLGWFAVSTSIILAMAYFANLSRVVEALQTANLLYLLPAFFFGLSVFLIWSYTWFSFFQAIGMEIGFIKSLKMFMAGHFFNSVTPLGQFGGEPFMAYVISKNTEYSAERGFSAVLSADIINAVPTLTFVLAGALFQFFFAKSVNQIVIQVLYIVIATLILGGALVYLLWFKSGRIESFIISLIRGTSDLLGGIGAKYVNSLDRRMENVQDAFGEVGQKPGKVVLTAAVAHLGFLAQVFCLSFILMSLGFSFDLTPLYFVITISSLANFSPTPGGSGTFEAAMAGLLTVFLSMPFASAFIASVIFRFTTYWPGLLIGYIAFNGLEAA